MISRGLGGENHCSNSQLLINHNLVFLNNFLKSFIVSTVSPTASSFVSQVTVENDQLILHAENIEERDVAVFKKTMIRKVDLPGFVDGKRLHCVRESDLLTVSLPIHLPPKKRPPGVKYVLSLLRQNVGV